MKPLCFIVAATLLAGCGGSDEPRTSSGPRPTGVEVVPVGDVPPVDGDAEPIAGAGTRRRKVDELYASIPVVAGNDADGQPIHWRVKKGSQTHDGYADSGYGVVLGRPDYVTSTEEGTQPGSLDVKFARDMARDVCNRIVLADLARDPGDPVTLWRFAPVDAEPTAAALDENARYLLLRFHGQRVAAGDPAVTALLGVHQAALLAAAEPPANAPPAQAEAWRAVCVALLEDPAFHLH